VRYGVWVFWLIVPALVASGCDDITNEEGPTTLRVEISATDSPFLAAGDTLVGDTVQFEVQVFDGQTEMQASDLQFAAVGGAVEILNASTGRATFADVGQSTVTVTVGEPDLGGAVTLHADMTVIVKRYDVELALVSTVTGAAVEAENGLLGDTVRVEATVRKGTEEVSTSGLNVTQSTDDQVANPAAPGADVVSYDGTGDATLTATLSEPPVPGDAPLTATVDVSVKDFAVDLSAESLVPGSSHLANGDTLVTDSVVFRATVVRAGNDTLKNNTSDGTLWTSESGGAIVEMKSDSVGAFRATGQDTVFVEFTDLDLPGEPFKLPIRVTTYNTAIGVTTLVPGSDHLATGDTLLTDSVQVTSTVTRASDGAARASSIAYLESTDSTVVSPRDSTIVKNQALFADTGTATITAHLAQPQLPRASLQGDLDLEISTYLLTADSATSETPVMGDTVQYYTTVIDTRDGSQVGSPVLSFASSNATAVRVLSAATGRALARDTGSAEVNVTLTDPDLPRGTVADTFAVTDISEERFYGKFDVTTGDFGDTVIIAASEVHAFTDSTKIFFPNGTVLFVDSVIDANPDTIVAIVGAGANSGLLKLSNLWANGADDRDDVPTRITFTSPGSVADAFEPNDTFPLAHADSFIVPGTSGVFFEEYLSIDPTKSDPIDNDFFWFTLTENVTLDITAEWQQEANIDFYVCTGVGVPPSELLGTPCQLEAFDTSTAGPETGSVSLITGGPYVLRFWCKDNCPTVPLTYKVTISRQ
jgi:hypothetical protein